MNSPTLLVHSLNDYNTPKFAEALKDFRSTQTKAYSSSLEILGQESKCDFDVSGIIDGDFKYSGNSINRLGYFMSC